MMEHHSTINWWGGLGFGIVNTAEIEVFLELSCFFNDPADKFQKMQTNLQ